MLVLPVQDQPGSWGPFGSPVRCPGSGQGAGGGSEQDPGGGEGSRGGAEKAAGRQGRPG